MKHTVNKSQCMWLYFKPTRGSEVGNARQLPQYFEGLGLDLVLKEWIGFIKVLKTLKFFFF